MMRWQVFNAQLKTCKINFDQLKFARDAYTVGRHPLIKDGLGFQREAKNLTSHKAPVLNKEKGKAPMASSSQKCHAYIYDRKYSRNVHRSYDYNAFDSHAMFASSSTFVHGRSRPRKIMLCIMWLRECVMNLLPFTMLAILLLRLYVRMKK
jgi:DNA repair photolyase